jgi:predicted anti-sigma-YlaC factor YlaD
MDCEITREALSAWLDGEPAVPRSAEVHAHTAGCADCRNWQGAVHQLARRVQLIQIQPKADDTARILEAVIADRTVRRRPRGWRLARGWQLARGRQLVGAGLAVAALAQFVISVPALVLGHGGIGIPPAAARDLGAFNLALAVGFAAAALRPSLARGMLPVVGAATVCLIGLGLINAIQGVTTVLSEAPHLIAVVGLVLLRVAADRRPTTYRHWSRR